VFSTAVIGSLSFGEPVFLHCDFHKCFSLPAPSPCLDKAEGAEAGYCSFPWSVGVLEEPQSANLS
jgi:hypothetical protein